VTFSALAEKDAQGILQYALQTWGPDQQDAYADALDEVIRKLASYPRLGRAREEIGPGVRSFRVKRHIILYGSTTNR